MGLDITRWALDEILEDFQKKPVTITIEELSEKFILKGTLQAFKKERGKNGKKHIPKNSGQNRSVRSKMVKRHTNNSSDFAKSRIKGPIR